MKDHFDALTAHQASRLVESVDSMVSEANESAGTQRKITALAAATVVRRSLASTHGLDHSIREHRALADLSDYISLAQRNQSRSLIPSNTDLLPVSHPRSTRSHSMTHLGLFQAQARWFACDPRVLDENRSLVAAAITSEPGSIEHTYATSRISAASDGSLLAVLLASVYSGGNSRAARSARARAQRRDRYGRFAFQGGGLRLNIRMPDGTVRSFSGRIAALSSDGVSFDIETDDGTLYRVPANFSEAVKAILPGGGDGFSDSAATTKTGDPVLDYAELPRLDLPSGYKRTDDGTDPNRETYETEAGDYIVEKSMQDGKPSYRVFRNDDDRTEVGTFDSWTKANSEVIKDGKKGNKEAAIKARLEGKDSPEAEYDDYLGGIERAAEDEDSDAAVTKNAKNVLDYINDDFLQDGDTPEKLAERLRLTADAIEEGLVNGDADYVEDLRDAADAVERKAAKRSGKEQDQPAFEPYEVPEGAYDLKNPAEFEPKGRTNQDSPDYTDDPAELAQKFSEDELLDGLSEALFNPEGAGPLSFDGGDEDVPAEAIYNALAEQGADAELITADLYDAGFEDNSAPNSKRIRDRRSKKEQGKKAEIPQEGEKEKTDWKPSDTRKEIPYDTIEWEDDGQGGGRAINKSGSTEILDIAGRKVVVVNVNGQDVPFYLSTGSGGKKGVEAGKWYPFFGLGPDDGWINKTSEAEINDYYGSPELRAMAEWLDANVGDVRDDQSIPKAKATGSHVDFINESLGIDPANNQESNTKTKVDANIAEIKKRISEGSGDSAQPKAQIPESADEKSNLPSEEKITDLPQQQRDADVENTASKLHDIWREGRKNEDGSYEPRMKDDGQGGEVDIANTDYADLPEKWQAENRASADHVVNLLRDEQAPADQDPMEWAAEEVHKSWLDRNGSWAPEEQKLPYTQLSEEEKQKDRDVVQAALDVLGMDSPKQKSDSDNVDKSNGKQEVMRGVAMTLPEDVMKQVQKYLAMPEDESEIDQQYKVGDILLDEFARKGAGKHWTGGARGIAEIAAGARRGGNHLPVIVHAEYYGDQFPAGRSALGDEDEHTIPDGTPMRVTRIEVKTADGWVDVLSNPRDIVTGNKSIDIEPSSVELRMTTDEDLPVVPGEADPYADEDFPPTQEQKDIVDAVLTGDDVVVRALAGTGKTSTLKLIARRLKKDSPLKKIIYIAFNKSVQVEAEAKMPDNVESRTADSIAWRWADKKITGKRNKKDNIVKIKDIAAHLGVDNIPDPNNPGEWFSPTEAVVYARKAVDKFTISADDEIGPQHFEGGSSPELLDLAKRMWADYSSPEGRLGIKNNHVTKMWALSRPDLSDSASGVTKGADIIFFDEAQDINPVLAKVVADQKIQKIYVGDENQAIYGFRGAEDELQNVKAPHDLALTKSWRFGPQIAGMGNRFLEFLGSKRRVEGGGPNGEILDSGTMEDADAILVRTNAGALQAIMEELDRGRSVGVAAKYKEELQRLVDTAEWLKNGGDPRSKPRDIHEDLVQFSSWKEVLDASKEENVNYDPKVAMLAGMVESQGIDGMRDILDRVKIASSKEDGNEAGVAPLTQADAEDGASGKIADGVDYKIEGSKIVLSGKGMFPVKEKLKASGFRWNPESKTWWRNEDSPEERLTMLTNLRNKVGGVVEAQPVDVVVSTAHKAKGLEWDRVRIGDDFRKPKENEFGQPMIAPEEVRLAYVAVTRARKALDPGSLDWIYKYEGRNLNPNQDETTETPSALPDQPDAPDTGLPEPEQQDVPANLSDAVHPYLIRDKKFTDIEKMSDEEIEEAIQEANDFMQQVKDGDQVATDEEKKALNAWLKAMDREKKIRSTNLDAEDRKEAREASNTLYDIDRGAMNFVGFGRTVGLDEEARVAIARQEAIERATEKLNNILNPDMSGGKTKGKLYPGVSFEVVPGGHRYPGGPTPGKIIIDGPEAENLDPAEMRKLGFVPNGRGGWTKDTGFARQNGEIPNDVKEQNRADLEAVKALAEGSASPEEPPAVPEEGTPSPAQRITVAARDLQPGDVAVTDRNGNREYFIIDEVREGGEKGKMVVIGHYPGHQQQEKQWKGGTKISVVRGADVPPPGDGPEIHKPDIKEYLEKDEDGNVKKGQWVKDENDQWYVPNPEKQAEYRAAMDAVWADIVEASKGFDDPTRGETADQPAPAPKKPKTPFPPGAAPLQGRLAELAREANGDPKKFRELLSAEKVYVFDFETTGIVKDENGKMVSPGQPWAVSIAQIDPMTGDVIEQKTIYMNPGEPLGDWAKENLKDADGNPLTDEWLAGQADKADAFAEVTEFLKSDTNPILIGHNIDFDEPILRENAEKLGLYTYSPAGMGDTMSLSRYLQREDQFAKNTLGALANKYKIENPDWHNAENDVKITAKIFDALLKDFEDNGIPFDMDAMQEWHDARVAEFEQKKEAFENVIAQEKASSLVAEAIHSGNKPDIDKAVSEVVNDIQRVESPVPAQNDDEYIASQLDDDESAVEADQRAALGARPGIADGPVEREIGIGVYFELDNGDRISIIDDGFGNKESAYLKTDGDGHKVLHWSIQKWNPDDSDEDIANGVLDDLYGSKKTSSDPDVESASPETQSSDLPPFIDLPPATPDPELNQANEDLVEAKKIVFELNKVDNLDGEMGEALADAIEDFFNIADNGFEFDNARRGAKDIERIAANLDDVAELGEERNLEVGSLARLAENIRGFAQNLRRRGGSGRVRGGDVAQRQPQPDAKATPPEARVDGTNGGGVRTPRNPGERARGITNGSNLPGVPMGENVEAVAPDGRRLLRRNRENRNFWDHPLASLPRRRFNKPWEGQFVDKNNIPIADRDVVHFYKKDRFGKTRRGVVIGRKDNVVRQNGPNRDFVLVRWDDGRTGFYVSHHLEIQNPDLDWRFLVNPDEERNDPASKRMNLPPGLNWDDFRAGEAPRNTRGQNGQLRGEGRNRNNLPVNEGDDLQKFERHELEGHITDTDGAIIYIGDRVEHVGKVGEKRGLVSGVVIGKKLVKVDNVNYGYQPIVRWDTPGVPVKNWSAKALRVLNADKADRKIGDEQANIPVLKKGKKGEGQDGWIPDPDNGPNEPINPPPPPVYAIDNVIFGMAGEAGARALNVANRLPEEDRGQALELVAAIAALRDGINAGVNPDKIAEAVSEVSGMAKKFSDAVKKDRDLNAPDDEGAEPARYFMGFARVLDAYAKDLRARGEAKPRNDFDVSGMEARTGILAGDIKVGDKVDISGFVAVVNSIHDMPNGESVSVSMVYPNGNGRVYIAKKNEPFMAAVFRDKKTSKDDGTEPFIPRDFRRVDTTAKDLAVGDFIPTKKGNYGRITDIEVSDRNGAVKVTVEYENGNSFTYNWMGKNTPIQGALIPDGARVPQAKKPVENKETPAAPAAPEAPEVVNEPQMPANIDNPVVDRAGNKLSVGQVVRHNNDKKAKELGNGVIVKFEKDPKYGKDVVKVRFSDGSVKKFRADRVFGQDQGQQQKPQVGEKRPARDYEDVLLLADKLIPSSKKVNIKIVLDNDRDLSDLDLKTRMLINKYAPAMLSDINRRGDNKQAKDMANLVFALNKIHLEQNPAPEGLGPIGEELFNFDISDVIRQIDRNGARRQAGTIIPIKDANGNSTDWHVETLNMGAIGYTFFMVHKSGQRFIVKKEKREEYAAKEVVGAAIARGLGIPGATFVTLHPRDNKVSIQTFAGGSEPLSGPAKLGRSLQNQDSADIPVDNIVRMLLLDGLIDNGDRHGGNYLFGEISDSGEREIHVFPIDMGLGAFRKGGGLAKQNRFDPVSRERSRLQDFGSLTLEEVSKMSLQELIQYLRRYADPGTPNKLIRDYAQNMIDKADDAILSGIPGRFFGI